MGSLVGSGNSSAASVNLTTEGTADWNHWGDGTLNQKAAAGATISDYSQVGSIGAIPYVNDPRPISWIDGTPTGTSTSNTNGLFIAGLANGFSFTAPASQTQRSLIVHVGGFAGGGTLTAHLSDSSAPDYVDINGGAGGQYDQNYTIVYAADSPGQKITITWVVSSVIGAANVTLSGAALQVNTISTSSSATPARADQAQYDTVQMI